MSAARQALEGAAIAPRNLSILSAFTNLVRRPPAPREPLRDEKDFQLDQDIFWPMFGRQGEALQQAVRRDGRSFTPVVGVRARQ